jgi:hypothetical protein
MLKLIDSYEVMALFEPQPASATGFEEELQAGHRRPGYWLRRHAWHDSVECVAEASGRASVYFRHGRVQLGNPVYIYAGGTADESY